MAIQCLAAVLGGCQSLHANGLDEALALPTEQAALLALRTQQMIAQETGVANTIDPVGGSYAIEKLTNEIEAARRNIFPGSTRWEECCGRSRRVTSRRKYRNPRTNISRRWNAVSRSWWA